MRFSVNHPMGSFKIIKLAWLGFAAMVLLTTLACGRGDGTPEFDLVVEDVEWLEVATTRAIMAGGAPSDVQDAVEDSNLSQGLQLAGINFDELDTVINFNVDNVITSILAGTIDYEEFRDFLENSGLAEDTYRDYEFWSRRDAAAAILEERGQVLFSDGEEQARDALDALQRNRGRLPADATIKRAFDKVGTGWHVVAVSDCNTVDVRRCEASAIAASGSDGSDTIVLRAVYLFRNAASAESQLRDVEDSWELIDDSWIEDAEADGEFVVLIGTIDGEEYVELMRNLRWGELLRR